MFALYRVTVWERDCDDEYVVGVFEGALYQVSYIVLRQALPHHRLEWMKVGFYRHS